MGVGMVVLIEPEPGALQKKCWLCWLIKRNCGVYEQELEFDQRTQVDSNQQKSWSYNMSYPQEKNRNSVAKNPGFPVVPVGVLQQHN